MRAFNAPKFGKDGRPIVYPTYAISDDIEIVSCKECRVAVGAGPWDGRLVPRRWAAPRAQTVVVPEDDDE